MGAKIFIDGEAGTTGLQIRQRLADRADLERLSIPAADRKDKSARAHYLNDADIAILCLPDEEARGAVALISSEKTRVIDASSAHRVSDGWTYGFAEMSPVQRDAITSAKRVSNPGCYPQGPIALLRPLIEEKLLPEDYPVVINAISGYSGGGRKMIDAYEGPERIKNNYAPYALGLNHKHLPELKKYAGLSSHPLLQPAVGNFRQGMMSVVPLQLAHLDCAVTGAQIHACLTAHYETVENSFVDVQPFEQVERMAGLDPEQMNARDNMQLYVFANDERAQILLIAIYDNLGKGAAGAAVQNLDLMLGI